MQRPFLSKQGSQIRWFMIGVLIGIILAHMGLLVSVLIVAGLAILLHFRGYRITLIKNENPNERQ